MILIEPTEEQIERAKNKFKFGELKNSITKGQGNEIGALGEILVVDYYRSLYGDDVVIENNTYDWDIIANDFTVDVKTKSCTSEPLGHYNVSVSNSNIKQKCQYYCFVRIMSDYSKAWILGFIPKGKYFKIANFYRKGQPDPLMPEWKFKDDCYNLEIDKLSL